MDQTDIGIKSAGLHSHKISVGVDIFLSFKINHFLLKTTSLSRLVINCQNTLLKLNSVILLKLESNAAQKYT